MSSSYFLSLDYEAQKRYLEKLTVLGVKIADPYGVSDDLWIDDPTQWPDVEFGDVYNYLINTKGRYTKESLNAWRSLDAYNYFYNGFVQTVYCLNASQGIHVLKTKVNPSQKAVDQGHSPWVAVKAGDLDCRIKVAHCTCKAG